MLNHHQSLNTKNKPTLSNNRVQSKRKEEVVD